MFSLLENTPPLPLALVGVPSRRQVIWETVFRVPDLTPLPCSKESYKVISKMSIVGFKNHSNDNLKKRLAQLIDIEDWTDECGKCGYPRLLHKELHGEAAYTKDAEVPNILKKNWEEYRKWIKPILKVLKDEFKKDIEQS